jgi:hypothetical protein
MMSHLVRLKYATTQQFAIGGIPGGVSYTYIRVKVKNIAYDKTVQAHYKASSFPDMWADMPLSWMGNYGNYDVFGRDSGFTSDELVIVAAVGGQTEWDNNNGSNYNIQNFHSVVGGHVVLDRAVARQGMQAGGGFTFQTSWFEGDIYVNNLNYEKRIGVRYTADGWTTSEDSDAVYAGLATEGTYSASSGVELWRVRTPEYNYNHASDSFEFAVYYQRLDTGAWFWDNNFSTNYRLSKLSGAALA